MDKSVDYGDDTGGVGKHLGPFGEGAIGGHDRWFVFVAPVDDFEEQVGMAIAVGQVSYLVN